MNQIPSLPLLREGALVEHDHETLTADVVIIGSGMGGGVEGFFSHMEIPLEAGVIVDVSQNVDLGGVLQFPNLFGDGGSFRWRQLGLLGRFRFN